MRRIFLCVLLSFGVFVVMGSSDARAVVTLLLESSADLQALAFGEAVTFNVRLSGLQSGQELDMLAATINYNGARLGMPTILPGEIVPDPLANPLDFLASPAVGQADASFSTDSTNTSSASHIRNNGVFFSFQTQPSGAGKGQLSIDVAFATQFNPAKPEKPTPLGITMGPALGFTVLPEPSTWVLLVTAALTGIAYSWKRRLP